MNALKTILTYIILSLFYGLIAMTLWSWIPARAWYQPPPAAMLYSYTVSPYGNVWGNYVLVPRAPVPYQGGAVQQGLDPEQYNASHGIVEEPGCYNLDAC